VSLLITGATVVAQAGLARVLIPSAGTVGGAIASSGAYLAGFLAALAYLVV
jgi:hypothetical protein